MHYTDRIRRLMRLWPESFRRDSWLPWIVAGLAIFIACIQLGSNAYRSEFDGHPDEAGQFVTGLMVRDYALHWPLTAPVPWAQQYYVHYPKVAFGHWPPFFHFLEAAAMLLLPPARWSVILPVGLLGFASGLLFYLLARKVAHPAIAAVLTALLLATPVFQEAASQTMAETFSLFLGLLFVRSLAHIAEGGPTPRAMVAASLWCAAAILVKGTGVTLIPAIVLAALAGRPDAWKSRALWLGSLCLFGGGLLFFVLQQGSLRAVRGWGGMWFDIPWPIGLVPGLAGWGVLALSAGGAATLVWRRSPVIAAAAATFVSMAVASYFMRAVREPRHWILALPPLFLLAAASLQAIAEAGIPLRRLALLAAASVALGFFPWRHYQQEALPRATILDRLHLPARILVSAANSWHEGGWIAMVSLREQRPASLVARATKMLSQSDWNGNDYLLMTPTPPDVEAALDRYGIEEVIVDDRLDRGIPAPKHHGLLKRTLATSPKWRECAAAGVVSAWCRVSRPVGPVEPMDVRIGSGQGNTLREQ